MFILIVKPNNNGEHLVEQQFYYTGKHTTECKTFKPILTPFFTEAKKYEYKGLALRAKEKLEKETGYEVTLYDTSYEEEERDYYGTL